MLSIGRSILGDFQEASRHEWLEANGLGGWASSSVIGCNTRRYHGLLVAATRPPAERMVLVSKLDETIVIGDQRAALGVNQYAGDTIHPRGFQYYESFSKDLFPQWIIKVDGLTLRKSIAMIHGRNTTVIVYEVLASPTVFQLELMPLLSVKGYHSLMHANDATNMGYAFEESTLKLNLYENSPGVFIHVPGGTYHHLPDWYFHFQYAVERYRGLDSDEDLFSPGHFSLQLKEGDVVGVMLSSEPINGADALSLVAGEENRRKALVQGESGETARQLTLAADQFIVKRGDDLKTVIAGYHWFTDWGRDTMISLPGLCLSTGRLDDAERIMLAFSRYVSMGMLPNRFPDYGQEPEYNNVDGTLWYFIAVHHYLDKTQKREFVLKELLPVLKDIIDWHFRGTRYNIHVCEDGLLGAGEAGQQLTWMDARIGDWVVTPRMGKPVEIQALWYNALKIFAGLLRLNGQEQDAARVEISAGRAKDSFERLFWYEEGGYLYDVIDEHQRPDPTLRPNQLFAISLPHALIEGKKASAILNIVGEQLYTPVGLRSLPVYDRNYAHSYGGDAWKRDSSYHQGTVWSWLLGAYVDAMVRLDRPRADYMKVIENFTHHLQEGCIGSVSEIFDADPPFRPRGCIAQAWGVAEWLRIVKQYT